MELHVNHDLRRLEGQHTSPKRVGFQGSVHRVNMNIVKLTPETWKFCQSPCVLTREKKQVSMGRVE